MAKRAWVYSDPHFYHDGICRFTNADGSKVRPWDDSTVMTEEMIDMYNELVADTDRVYILGDVAFSAAKIRAAVSQLKGKKVLVPGNHEPPKMRQYFDVFDDVRGYVQRRGFIMSHIPLHPESLGRWGLNIHGHLHSNVVKSVMHKGPFAGLEYPDTRYFNASVEQTNFRPKLLDEILHERLGS